MMEKNHHAILPWYYPLNIKKVDFGLSCFELNFESTLDKILVVNRLKLLSPLGSCNCYTLYLFEYDKSRDREPFTELELAIDSQCVGLLACSESCENSAGAVSVSAMTGPQVPHQYISINLEEH